MRPADGLHDYSRQALSQRVREHAGLKFAQFAETVLWSFIEETFFEWFPGFSLDIQQHLQGLNNFIRQGGKRYISTWKSTLLTR
jgi:hypothetical protein